MSAKVVAMLVGMVAVVAGGSAFAQPVATSKAAKPLGCLIEPLHVAEVGSQVIGVIQAIHVERGDRVRKGQVLVELRAGIERAALSVAAERRQATADVAAATAAALLGRQKLERSIDLANKKFISSQALEQARAEAEVAEQKLAQAQEQRRIWASEHELAQAQLAVRQIVSPSDGVVAERYLSPGERVEDKPILRIAMVDPLRVEIVLPSSLFGTVRIGDQISIAPELPNAAPRMAKVTLVDKLVDGPSNTFRVRLEMRNPGSALPAGLRCIADLTPPQSRAAPPAAPRTAPPTSAGMPLRLEPSLRTERAR